MFATKIIDPSARLADEAIHAAGHAVQSTSLAVDRAMQAVGSMAVGARNSVRHSIRDEPMAAVLIALGAGAVLATLVGLLALRRSGD